MYDCNCMTPGGNPSSDSTSFNIIRSGFVTQRRLTNIGAQVVVFYPDRNVSSDWISWSQSGSKGNIFYTPPPQVGDEIVTLHMPTGIERAIAICSKPNPQNRNFLPGGIDCVSYQGLDGSYFEYDPVEGCLSINGIKTCYFNCAGGQLEAVMGQLDIEDSGDCNITVGKNLNATVSGNLLAKVTGTAELDAASTIIKGPVTFQDAVTC